MKPLWSARGAALVAIVVLGASLRLLYVENPLADMHRWRQLDTAAIARNMYRHSLNPLYPEVDWGGPKGYVEAEFPLVPFLAATLYRAFGVHETFGRLISIAFSLGAIVLIYYLGRMWLGPPAGRAAAFLMAVSPGSVFYGRTFMPDSAMVCLSIAIVLGFFAYFRDGRVRWLVWGSLAAGLAWLVKLPAIMMLAVIAAIAWEMRRWKALRDLRFVAAVAIPLLVAIAWYYHAWQIYRQTGITFGLIGHPAETYPRDIWYGPWTPFSKWSTRELLTSAAFYGEFFERFYFFHLLPWGLVGAVVGMMLWRRSAGRFSTWAWLGIIILFILVAGNGNLAHDYYQLPIVPVAALFFAVAAAPLFDGQWIAARVATGWKGIALAGAVMTALALVTFYYSGVIETHFRPHMLDTRMLSAGAAIDAVAPDEELAIVVDDYGMTSPVLLYFANLRGWSFDPSHASSALIAWLRKRGARLFVTTTWSSIQAQHPDAVAYLEYFKRVPLAGAPSDTVVFDLSEMHAPGAK